MEPDDGCLAGQAVKGWLQITSERVEGREAAAFLRDVLRILATLSTATSTNVDAIDAEDQVAAAYQRALSIKDAEVRPWAGAISGVLSDLAQQGWALRFSRQHLWGVRPAAGMTRDALRQRLLVRRDEQLSKEAVRSFIRGMEQWRPFQGQRISVVSLLRDGKDLASQLRCGVHVSNLVEPYVQFVSGNVRCQLTGLHLQDVWRYFRHTWSSPYESVPGRSLQFLVRDKKTPFHTVVGIGALSSAAVRLGPRDRFIGWDTDLTVERLLSGYYPDYRAWTWRVVEGAISEIYKVDLIRDELLPADSNQWTLETASKLASAAASSKAQHHRLMDALEYKTADSGLDGEAFVKRAELPLFRAKRALELSRLISVVVQLRGGVATATEERDLLSRVVRIARTKTVGTEIADLTVCGAIAPYSHLGAGKLVAMLAVSPEVVAEYGRRYKGSPGVIASSMAGRAIGRQANVCYVGTSSLYGLRPNQYDRLAMPVPTSAVSGHQFIRYEHIKDAATSKTQGVGTFQFSSKTLRGLERFVSSGKGGWKANNVFGEGTSPKLRGLRDGLNALGLIADLLLIHGMERCMYGVKLATNVDRYLLGFDESPQWIVSPEIKAAPSVGRWWIERWASARASRQDVLSAIERDRLAHPIRHGGRVQLPERDGAQGEIL